MSWRIVVPLVLSLLGLETRLAVATPLDQPATHLLAPARLLAEARRPARVDLYLDLPPWFLRPAEDDPTGRGASSRLDERWLETFSLQALEARAHVQPGIRGVMPWVVDPLAPEQGWRPLVELLPPIPAPPRRPSEALMGGPQVLRGAHSGATGSGGALTGRVVYVSAGHGWAWNDTLGRWATQRGNTNYLVEDFLTAEAVNHYLVPYLERAGATVFTTREHDLQGQSAVVDAEPGGTGGADPSGLYQETGDWQDSQAAGFAVGGAPYEGAVNPMTLGGNRITPTVEGEPTAVATWVPEIPGDAPYTVYVSYSPHESRAQDAHYIVTHRGGETHFRLNQQRHGQTWVRLGTFAFEAGQDASRGAVSLLNDTGGEAGTWVSADAVRFGGGQGDLSRGTGSGVADSPTSGRPRWEECARYYAQFAGAPPEVWDYAGGDSNDDVSARSRYAAWQNESGEDAVYISWHTNAPNPGRGTSTYVYGPNAPDGSYQFSGTAGSDQLAEWIHDEIVGDIRAAFDPSWKDRGIRSAYFGEVNPSHNPEMPAVLVEVAFHDTAADAAYLQEPRFRSVVARAFTQGLIRFFAARDDLDVVLPPETPRSVRAWSSGSGRITVAWEPPEISPTDQGADTPTGYRIYVSDDGVGFDEGTVVEDAQELEISEVIPGIPLFVRITAYNSGGESMPSPTIPVIPPCDGGPPPALLVHGFYRLDGVSQPTEDMSPWSLGQVQRHRQAVVNTYDYLVPHAWAFARARIALDGAEAAAIEEGLLALDPYELIDWQLGEESTEDETLSKGEQLVLRSWLMEGDQRALLVSGAELLWDLDFKGDEEDQAFASDWLGVRYEADDAHTYGLHLDLGVIDGSTQGVLEASMDDGTHGTFDVDYADLLAPEEGAVPWITYDGDGGIAGTRFLGSGGHVAYVLGFPLESIVEADVRDEVVQAITTQLSLPKVPSDCGPGPGGGDGTAEAPPDAWTGDAVTPRPDLERPNVIRGPTTTSTRVEVDPGCSSGPGAPPWLLALLALVLCTRRGRRSGPSAASGR